MPVEEPLFSRDGLFLLISSFLNTVPFGYINVVPLVYLAEIGYDPSTIGVIYSASAVATTIGLIPCGLLADRYGRKKLLLIGTFLPIVSYLIFGLTLDSSLLTVASIIGGVGFAGGLGGAATSPPLFAMLASSTAEKKRSTIFGVLYGAWAVALALGSALSFLPTLFSMFLGLNEKSAHFDSYFVMSLVAAAAVLPLLFVKEKPNRTDPNRTSGPRSVVLAQEELSHQSRTFGFSVRSQSSIAQFSLIFTLTGFGLGVLVQLLPTWFNLRYGVSETTVGVWMAVSDLATIVSIPLIPRLVSRRGDIFTAASTGVVGAFVLGLMAFAATFEAAASLFAIRSVIIGVSWAVVQSYMMSAVTENQRGTIVGFSYTTWGLGVSVGTLLGGELLGAGLLNLPFLAAVISYVASSTAIWFFFRKAKPSEPVVHVLPRFGE